MQRFYSTVKHIKTGEMFIKVCGIKYPENLKEVILLSPDAIGFIFYSGSPRFVGTDILPYDVKIIPGSILKTGIFVNEIAVQVLKKADEYNLDLVQLHGDETPAYCEMLSSYGINLIKAFSVDDSFDFSITDDYSSSCKYFLFDTRGKKVGGNGIRFNWDILEGYPGTTKFLLSGGINPESIPDIKKIRHNMFTGLDLNSGFEIEPGRKSFKQLEDFIKKIRK